MDDPYHVTNISARVDIPPNLLISKNIYHNIKNRAKELYEKKCNRYGYVDVIYKIIKYENGMIIGENFDGNVIFNITYTARICYPKINSIIQCNIKNINKTIISAENGPIMIIINTQNINKKKFKFNANKNLVILDKDKLLEQNDSILVKIIATDYHNHDNNIFVYGYLENYIS